MFTESNRGLWQGNPLSTYLLCMEMEYFSVRMENGISQGLLNPINRNQPTISHLLYDGDVMILLEANMNNAQAIKNILVGL